MSPRRPPPNPTKPPPPTKTFCPKTDDSLPTLDEERTACTSCGLIMTQPSPSWAANRNTTSADAQQQSVSQPPAPPPVPVYAPTKNTSSPDPQQAKPPAGRKPGQGNVWRFPRAAVADVAGIKPESLRVMMARKGAKYSPDADGLRQLVRFLAPYLGFVEVEPPNPPGSSEG